MGRLRWTRNVCGPFAERLLQHYASTIINETEDPLCKRKNRTVFYLDFLSEVTYPYYTNLMKKFQHCAGSKNWRNNPKTKAHHLVLPVTHTTLCSLCTAGVASKKIHSANGPHTLHVQCSQSVTVYFVWFSFSSIQMAAGEDAAIQGHSSTTATIKVVTTLKPAAH